MGKNNQQRRRAKATARRHTGGAAFFPQDDRASWRASSQGRSTAPEVELLDAQARGLVARGVHARVSGRQHEFDSVVVDLVVLSGTGEGLRVVVQTLAPMLRDHLTEAWRAGWQPSDVHRLAGRQLAGPEQDLLGDAMAEELGRYAAATVDPRWAAQLSELDAGIWWPQHQSYLESRGQHSDAGWLAVVESALKVLSLLWRLPRLEMLGPVPGTAVPASSSRRPAGAADVDERILSRVRALLAKAESTTFEAEAETFTAGAQALMARHSIDAALLAAAGEQRQGAPGGRRIGIDNPYEAPKAMLLTAVADANRCRTVWARDLGFTTVIGFVGDVDAVETLFTSLLVQATRAMTREGSRKDPYGRSRTRSFRQSFLSAFASRIGERLREVTATETSSAAAASSRSGGRELVPLLAARAAVVDEAVESMFPDVVMHSLRLGRDAEGWQSGRRAADRAALDSGPAVEQSSHQA